MVQRDYLEVIAKECNIYDTANVDDAIDKIHALDEKFEHDTLVEIYNYFLEVSKNPEILMCTIRCIDRIRDTANLGKLLDLLLLKGIEKDKFIMLELCVQRLSQTSKIHLQSLRFCIV